MSTQDDDNVLLITEDDTKIASEVLRNLQNTHGCSQIDALKALLAATARVSTKLKIEPRVVADFFQALHEVMHPEVRQELEAEARQRLQDKIEEDCRRMSKLNKYWSRECN